MAQKSKKQHIIDIARPLFLRHGFKGTSIDVVVKASKVSKPTVYNHFPDKAALFMEVLKGWIDSRTPNIPETSGNGETGKIIRNHWLTDDTVRFYALIIGEGSRIPEAKNLFWTTFDEAWRKAIAAPDNLDKPVIESTMDRQLLDRLKKLPALQI